MPKVRVVLEWFRPIKSWNDDDEEDLDVMIAVNGHPLYVAHNKTHWVNSPYGQGNTVVLDTNPARVHIVGAATCADYHQPHYGSTQSKHIISGAYGLSAALNGGAWEARYHVTFL